MLFTLEDGQSYEVDMPYTSHTYEEILNELEKQNKHEVEHLLYLVKNWPQTKQAVPYFYDYIFANNYKDAEKGFIKSLLQFPSTYEAEQVIFSLFEVYNGNILLPCTIGKIDNDNIIIIYFIRTLIGRILQFGDGCDFGIEIYCWKQVKSLLEKIINSNNIREDWNNEIENFSYDYNIVNKLKEENNFIGNIIFYSYEIPFKNQNK